MLTGRQREHISNLDRHDGGYSRLKPGRPARLDLSGTRNSVLMDSYTWQTRRLRNVVQSVVLLAAMVTILGLLGWLLAGSSGIVLAALAVVVIAAFSPNLPPAMVAQMLGGRAVGYGAAPELYDMLRSLAEKAGLERVPTLYLVPSPAVNAFAVGSEQRSIISVTGGLLRILSQRELYGVLAHETSHLRNGDTWLLNLGGIFTNLTRGLSFAGQFLLFLNIPLILIGQVTIDWLAIGLLIFAPTLNGLLQLALSRTREFDADLGAVALTGDPMGLASALEKLSSIERAWFRRFFRLRAPEDPLLLRSHPATRERIARLQELSGKNGMAAAGWTSRGDLGTPYRPPVLSDLEHYRPRRIARRPWR